jgi:asparagine synthase (glutamine-hydrolysing)
VDHEANTFFEGLWRLPAGHFLTPRRAASLTPLVDARSVTPRGRSPKGGPPSSNRCSPTPGIRVRADVEVGSCLSGGLDSSAVVTTASRFSSRPLHAFTCAYNEGPAYDERPYVRAVAEASGAQSHVVVPDGTDFWKVFDHLHDLQGEPTAGPGLYSQWKVMALAHEHGLKVLLDGQGGDETLAGYYRYLPLRLRDLLAAGPSAFARLFGPVSDRLGASTALALTLEPWLPWGSWRRCCVRLGKDRVLAGS